MVVLCPFPNLLAALPPHLLATFQGAGGDGAGGAGEVDGVVSDDGGGDVSDGAPWCTMVVGQGRATI